MNQDNSTHEVADPVQDFIDWLKKRTFFKVNKKKLLKRTAIFVLLFSLFNIWLYNIEYKRYVSQAPKPFVKAREALVNGLMFHIYYTFLVKNVRIDFMNPILYPLKGPRDYFYQKGLDALPVEEGERAFWFDMFEVRPYSYSVKAQYGRLEKSYGVDFSRGFITKLYNNIKTFSLYPITDKETPNVSGHAIEQYIDMVHIFVLELYINKNSPFFRDQKMKMTATDNVLYGQLSEIYYWQKAFLDDYKNKDTEQYNRALNTRKGWFGPYRNHYSDLLRISSMVLFYRTNNHLFDCKTDEQLIQDIQISRAILEGIIEKYPKTSRQYRTFSKEMVILDDLNKASLKKIEKNEMCHEM